jgi:cytochrome b
MNKLNRVKVWDLAVRVFHWGLVTAFGVAYFTGEDGWTYTSPRATLF